MATLEVQVLDVDAQDLGDPQAVQAQKRCQGVVAPRTEPRLDEEGAELVAIEAEGADS